MILKRYCKKRNRDSIDDIGSIYVVPVRYVFWVKGEGNNKLQELGDFYSMSEVHDGLRYQLLPWNGPCEKCQPQGGGRYTSVWRILSTVPIGFGHFHILCRKVQEGSHIGRGLVLIALVGEEL